VLVVPLPPTAELERLLSGLLAREVKLAAHDAVPAEPCPIALFQTAEPVLEVAVLCEVALAASLAAALSVIPAGAARESAAHGTLEPPLDENFGEVMNVVSRFVSGSGRRFALSGVFAPRAAPPELIEKVHASDERRSLSADIAGYLSGRMAFCTL
jgi:hypothetical protein